MLAAQLTALLDVQLIMAMAQQINWAGAWNCLFCKTGSVYTTATLARPQMPIYGNLYLDFNLNLDAMRDLYCQK